MDPAKIARNTGVFDICAEPKQAAVAPKHSRLNLVSQLKRCDSLNTGRKRKALDTSGEWGRPSIEGINDSEDPITFIVREAMQLVIRCSKELDKRILENPNTKREIKDLSLNLRKGAEVLGRETTKKWLDDHRWTKVEIPTYDVECQTNLTRGKEVECQTDPAPFGTTDLTNMIRDKKGQDLSATELKELLDLKWPEEAFDKCALSSEELGGCNQGNTILVCRRDTDDGHKWVRKIRQENHLIESAFADKGNLNPLLGVKTEMELIGEQSKEGSKAGKYTFVLRLNGEEGKDDSTLQEGLRGIADIVGKNSDVGLRCFTTLKDTHYRIRKHVEHAFAKCENSLELYRPKKDVSTLKETESIKMRKTAGNELIVIKPIQGSYTDILKKLKKDVPVGDVRIDRVLKGEDGNIRISIKSKKEEGREQFKKALTNTVRGLASVRESKKMSSVLLLDLDPEITEEDIRNVLEKAGIERKNLGSIRVLDKINKVGKKSAFASLPTELATQIVGRRRVGDGWDRWRVRDVVTPGRCFTCRQVGHEAKDCKAAGKGEVCHNCGDFGHYRRDCKNNMACYLCGNKGHRAESMVCSVFRDMVQTARGKGGPKANND